MAKITVNVSAIEELRRELDEVAEISIGRLGERGYQLLRKEVPYQTGNLKQGVAPPEYDSKKRQALLTVSARSARRGPRGATVHLKSGKTKSIVLRAQGAYNYAEVVARGYAETIKPKRAKALLIPVDRAPDDESYIESGGQLYVVRKSTGGIKANPYDERAARRLRAEAVTIVEAVAGEVFGGR